MSSNGYRRPRDEAEKVQRRLARYPEALRMADEGTARPQVAEAVRLLRAGLRGVEIAEAMGVGQSRAFALLNDPTGKREQERKHRHHGTCADCGGPTYNGGARSVPKRCDPCARRDAHETSVAWLVAEAHHWCELYGEIPAAMDWHPLSFNFQQRADATARKIKRRHAEDGPWPALNAVQGTFGTWNAFIEAAGWTPPADR